MTDFKTQAFLYKQGKKILSNILIRPGEIVITAGPDRMSWDEYSVNVTKTKEHIHVKNTVLHSTWLELPCNKEIVKIIESNLRVKISSLSSHASGIQELPRAIGLLLLLIMISIGLVTFLKLQSHLLVPYISNDFQSDIGKNSFRKNFKSKALDDNHIALLKLKELAKNINLDETYSLYILKDSTSNAFTLPGKIIMVNSGLILKTESPEEILGVLAHEMGHASFKHALKAYIEAHVSNILQIIILGNNTSMHLGESLIDSSFSRADEIEADIFATKLLIKNKLSPYGLISFFDKLKADNKDQLSLTKWFSTHPLDQERIKNIKMHIRSNETYHNVSFDLESLKNSLKN